MYHVRKRCNVLLGGVIIAAVFLLWCPIKQVRASKTVLTLWHPLGRATCIDAIEKTAREFEQSHPEVSVKIEIVPWPKHREKWTTAAAAGTLPDVFFTATFTGAQMWNAGVITTVDDLVEAMGGKENLFWAPETVKKNYEIQGHMIAMPLYIITRTLIYRKDKFQEKGLIPPVSWDEYIETSKALTDPPKFYGAVQMWRAGDVGATFALFQFMWSNKGTFFDKDGNAAFNTPENIEAVRELIKIYEVGSPPGEFSFSARDIYSLFTSGKSAMAIGGCAVMVPAFERESPDLAKKGALGFARPPVRKQSGRHINANGMVRPKGKNEKLAGEFIKYMLKLDSHVRLLHASPVGQLPVTKETVFSLKFWDHPLIKKYADTMWLQIYGMSYGSQIGTVHGLHIHAGVPRDFGIIERMFQGIALGKVTVEEGVFQAQEEMRQIIEEMKRR